MTADRTEWSCPETGRTCTAEDCGKECYQAPAEGDSAHQPSVLLDGQTPHAFVLGELYEFQQATGFDTAAEFRASQVQPKGPYLSPRLKAFADAHPSEMAAAQADLAQAPAVGAVGVAVSKRGEQFDYDASDEAVACQDCGGTGVDGDVDDSGKTIDVPCHCAKEAASPALTDEQRLDWLCEAAEFTCGQWQVVIESDAESFIDAVDELAGGAHGISRPPVQNKENGNG